MKIIASKEIQATEPVDDDHGAVVCTTSEWEVARDFAHEYERFSSPYPVGFIFTLDGAKIGSQFNVIPYEAETASSDEKEYRVQGDLPLKTFLLKIEAAGDLSLLKNPRFIRQMYEDNPRDDYSGYWDDLSSFKRVFSALLRACK